MPSIKSPSPLIQWGFATILSVVFLALIAIPFLVIPVGPYWFLYGLIILPFVAPLESLLLTPLYRLCGRFDYLSALLLATKSPNGFELHTGTLFDYVSHLKTRDLGHRAQRVVVKNVLEGLLVLCDKVDGGKIKAEIKLTATSYFFSDRTAKKLGFDIVEADRVNRINLYSAYLSLMLRLSFTKGKLTAPKLSQLRQISTTAGDLATHRQDILRMLTYLDRS